ncbi:5693_t:CDS:2, partial [Racocetra fulgida]
RKNTVNGMVYKDDPTIFAWELANEPQAVYTSNAHDVVFQWFDETSKFIKSLDKNHLVTTGTEGKHGKDWFITMHKSDSIGDPSPENLQRAVNFMRTFLQETSDWSTNILKKPVLLGEYGMARDGWTDLSKYDPEAPVTNRNKYFTEVAKTIFELEKQHAQTGLMFWAYSGIGRPSDSKPTWVGDPPHEETLRVFLDHAKQIKNENKLTVL